jgi:uncharacterized membrane protein YkoI
MKMNRFFIALSAAALLSSCTDDDLFPSFSPNVPPPQLPSGVTSFELCDDGDDFPISQLPAAVFDYLNSEFPGWEIEEADIYNQSGDVYYGVEIEKGSQDVEILFTADGQYVSHGPEDDDDQDIAISNLPQEILDYIAANFPDHNIDEANIEVEYGQWFYEVELEKPGSDDCEWELYFNGNYEFVCLDDDDDCDD